MSHSIIGNKDAGYDYWSRRCFGNGNLSYGKIPKQITRKKERTRNKKIIIQAWNNPEDVESRFPGE